MILHVVFIGKCWNAISAINVFRASRASPVEFSGGNPIQQGWFLYAEFIRIFFFLSSIKHPTSVRFKKIVIYAINFSVSPPPAGQEGEASL